VLSFCMSTRMTVTGNNAWIRLCTWITLGVHVMPLNNTPISLRYSILFVWITQLCKFLGRNDTNSTIWKDHKYCDVTTLQNHSDILGRLWEYKTAYRQREIHFYLHVCPWRVWKNSFVSLQNWICRSLKIFRSFRNVTKSHYLLHHVCPSFNPSAWKNIETITKNVSP